MSSRVTREVSMADIPPELRGILQKQEKRSELNQRMIREWQVFKILLEGADAETQYMLGDLYYSGEFFGADTYVRDFPKDYEEAVKWFRKAAEKGNVSAQKSLGHMYYSGCGVERDDSQAEEWYGKAANQGDEMAQSILDDMRFRKKIAKLLKEQGCSDSMIRYYSGPLPMNNIPQGNPQKQEGGSELNQRISREWKVFKILLEGADAETQYTLGDLYYSGEIFWADTYVRNFPTDYEEAANWFRKAAEKGNAQALKSLGTMYFSGQGVEKDWSKSVECLEKAVSLGDTSAQQFLGFAKDQIRLMKLLSGQVDSDNDSATREAPVGDTTEGSLQKPEGKSGKNQWKRCGSKSQRRRKR